MMLNKDALVTVKEINEKKGKCIYVVNIDDITVGYAWKTDIDKYLSSDDCPVGPHNDLDDVTLIHGWVLDPTSLPMEIPAETMSKTKSRSVWLFIEESPDYIKMDMLSDIEEVVEEIERYMSTDAELSIDSFAIIVGDELDLAICVAESGKTIAEKDIYEEA